MKNSKEPKITKLPPGPQNVHFQEYAFDEFLGEQPLVNKPIPQAEGLGPEKGMKTAFNDRFKTAFRKLNEKEDEE